jgi:dihydrodipicolinate synthase/N-acetylneuraminate lyase
MSDLASRLYVALLLPQDTSGNIDEASLRRLCRYFLQSSFADVGGFVVNPEAGEIGFMTRAEKRRVLEIVAEEANGRVPLFAGTYANTTTESVDTARDAKAIGASGLFAIPPGGSADVAMLWDPSTYPEIWLDQIKDQDRAVDLPIITHPVAAPTPAFGLGLPLATSLAFCRAVPNIIGWKMTYSYSGYRLVARGLRSLDHRVAILAAAANYFHENLASAQFDGTVSGSWNYALEPMLDHIAGWRRSDLESANRIWTSGLMQLHEYIYAELGRLHIRYKIAAWLRGLIDSPTVRPPMPKANEREVDQIYRLLRALGVPLISDKVPKLAA